MGQVIPITSNVDDAWERYATFARQLSADASLLADRSFNEEMARRHEAWRRLFMLQDRGA